MKVGDLVGHKEYHEYMGIVMEIRFHEILVTWHDGEVSWTNKREMKVIR
jgi:hypothetical protein